MKKKLYIAVMGIVVLLSSCATQNFRGTDNYSEKHISISDNEGNIIIKRDSGFMGGALTSHIFIDNVFIVKLNPGEFVQINLENGIHFITISSGEFVNLGTAFERTLRIEVLDRNKRTFRVFPMPTQGIMLEEIME